MYLRPKIFLATLLVSAVSPSYGAEFQPIGRRDLTIAIGMTGRITPDDGARLRELIAIATANGLTVSQIALNSEGGSVMGGADVALTVRNTGIGTFVAASSVCASSCFMVFAAGKNRSVENGARVGVHSATTLLSGESQQAKSMTVDMVRLLAELGTPAAVLGRLVTSRPHEIAWLTALELEAMTGKVTTPRASSSYAQEISTVVKSKDSGRTTVSSDDLHSARQLLSKASSFLRAERPVDALPILRSALELNPFDADLVCTYGKALQMSGQHVAAKDALALALRLNPKRGDNWQLLALTLAELGDDQWATECFAAYYDLSGHKDIAREQMLRWRADPSSSVNLKRAVGQALKALDIG
jgi:hypothetical protein